MLLMPKMLPGASLSPPQVKVQGDPSTMDTVLGDTELGQEQDGVLFPWCDTDSTQGMAGAGSGEI